jgi:hypothetical protein
MRSADLIMGNSNEVDLKDKYIFYGGTNSSIAYARCRPWNVKGNPCSDRIFRTVLRDSFYKEFERNGEHITRSFFPLAIKGIVELKEKSIDFENIQQKFSHYRQIKFNYSKSTNPMFKIFNIAVERAILNLGLSATKVEIPYETFVHEYNQELTSYLAEVYMLATGILIEEPMQDVRFMFFSKEGIRLPDEDGSIRDELEKQIPDLQIINKLLWDQAIIWPVTHYAAGLWAKPGIDFSLINLIIPPTDFQWLGSQ